MADIIPQEHGGAINRFSRGESGNPNGRPKKVLLQAKGMGYSKQEVEATYQQLINMTIDELKKVIADKQSTALEAVVAKGIVTDFSKGSTYRTDSLLDRIYGKAIEKKEETVNVNITSLKVEVVMTNIPIAKSEKELDV